jgi:hypothetical protein
VAIYDRLRHVGRRGYLVDPGARVAVAREHLSRGAPDQLTAFRGR